MSIAFYLLVIRVLCPQTLPTSMCTAYIASSASPSLKICICLYPKPPEGKYICLFGRKDLFTANSEGTTHVHKSSTEQFFGLFLTPDQSIHSQRGEHSQHIFGIGPEQPILENITQNAKMIRHISNSRYIVITQHCRGEMNIKLLAVNQKVSRHQYFGAGRSETAPV